MNLNCSRKLKGMGKRLCIMVLALMMIGSVMAITIPAASAADYECGLEAHTHTDECYELTCTTPVGEQYGEHFHGEGCYADTLTCECAEGVEHTAECYTSEKVCTLEEGDNVLLSNHTHADECYNTICPKTVHTHTEECGVVAASDSLPLQVVLTTSRSVGSSIQLGVVDWINGVNSPVFIDWGDGTPVQYIPSDNGLMNITGTVLGSNIKIYAAELDEVKCNDCGITAINTANAPKLRSIHATNNALTSIDVSANPKLAYLYVSNNQITSIDLSNNTALSLLHLQSNQLEKLDVSAISTLQQIICSYNNLTELKINYDSPNLYILDCSYNSLDFNTLPDPDALPASCHSYSYFSQDAVVMPDEYLTKEDVDITEYDLNGNTNFTWKFARNYSLDFNEYVFDKNENDSIVSFNYEAIDCQFECIMTNPKFPELTLMTERFYVRRDLNDPGHPVFSVTLADDAIGKPLPFDKLEESEEVYGGSSTGRIFHVDWGDGNIVPYDENDVVKGNKVTFYYIYSFWYIAFPEDDTTDDSSYNRNILDVDIIDCPRLRYFECENSNITKLDFSSCEGWLTRVDANNNAKLETVILSDTEHECLESFYVSNSKIKSLDFPACPRLKYISCNSSALTSLDVSECPELDSLYVNNNQLTELDLSGNPALAYLECANNKLTNENLDISKNTQLDSIMIGNNDLDYIDLSIYPDLQTLSINDTNITELDYSQNPSLASLVCDNTGISELDMSRNTFLILSCCNTNVSSLDLSNQTMLFLLACDNTAITELDLSNNQIGDMLGMMAFLSFSITNVTDAKVPDDLPILIYNGKKANLTFSDLPDPALVGQGGDNSIYPPEIIDEFLAELLGGNNEYGITKLFEYAPQAKVEIPSAVEVDEEIDLSSEYEVHGKNTVYKWFDGTTGVTPTTSEGGKFTFGSEFAGKKLRCEMTNENYPDLTLETTEVKVKSPYDGIKITVSGDIEWNNVPSGEDAPEVTVNLILDGEVVDSVIVPSGTTEYSFADVSKFAADGTELAYTVELDEIPENYEVSYSTPAADADGNITIDITGEFEEPVSYGALTISSTVTGEGAPTDAEFTYTVTFDSTESYPYTGSAAGTIKSGDKITLKNGQSITIANIPVGVKFDVTQDEAENFVTSPSTGKIEGVISATPSVAAFSNAYNPPVVTGNLTITNKVTGENADTSLKFSFKVEFDAEGSYELRIYGAGETIPANATGMLGGMSITAAAGSRATVTTIKSGDTIQLAHGETAIIYGLPSGTTYKVTETENKAYKLTSTGASGTVSQDGAKASFINEKIKSSGGDSNVPDTGDYGTGETVALYVMQIAMMAMLMCVYSMKKLKKQNESEQF